MLIMSSCFWRNGKKRQQHNVRRFVRLMFLVQRDGATMVSRGQLDDGCGLQFNTKNGQLPPGRVGIYRAYKSGTLGRSRSKDMNSNDLASAPLA